MLIALLAVYLAYRLYVQWIEKRPVYELSEQGAVKETSAGLLIGLALVTMVVGILWLVGSYQAAGTNPWLVLLPAAVANIPSGFVQEILFRGNLLRITQESLGTWIALLLSTLLFGLVHIFSAGATLLSTLSILLEAGVLLGAAYIFTERLWLVIGIHVAWDLAVDGIFGIGSAGLSGSSIQGLLQGRLSGGVLLSGGDQGVEASIITVTIALLAGIVLLWLAWRNGRFVRFRDVKQGKI